MNTSTNATGSDYILSLTPDDRDYYIFYDNVDSVDISELDKVDVLIELWMHSKNTFTRFNDQFDFDSVGSLTHQTYQTYQTYQSAECDIEQVLKILNSKEKYADYLCGRVIKTSFKTDTLNSKVYDSFNGAGSMKRIIYELRKKTN